MPVNLELKARIRSLELAEKAAENAGAVRQGTLRQRDTYFCAAHGRLKLREIDGQDAELIQYERVENGQARLSDYTKVRVADADDMRHALAAALGTVVEVRKERLLYLKNGSRIHLDRVESLGTFIEFEVPDDGSGSSEKVLNDLRLAFDVREGDLIAGSYCDLLLA